MPLSNRYRAPGVEQVEQVGSLQHTFVGRQSETLADQLLAAGLGVIETPEQLLASVDMALGEKPSPVASGTDTYTTVGLGSQILKDLGVGKIHLMGAPIKYNAISGFDLEVLDFVNPEQ